MNPSGRQGGSDPAATDSDAQALERYRYMLASAPPEDIERAHEEAFARLTSEQRREALQALAQHVPAGEVRGDDPASLARAATRAEIRQPGTIERAWGGGGAGGAGFGLGSWFMTTLAASFIGTAIAQSFFDNDSGAGDGGADGSTADADSNTEADSGDAGGDYGSGDVASGDLGGGDLGGGDMGGEFGDFGGF
ncbi:MAG: hypothetical protein H0U52_02540 [Chloroflexi bacterium]|nr:hypothetical protein [Chloroflexota bacterium]